MSWIYAGFVLLAFLVFLNWIFGLGHMRPTDPEEQIPDIRENWDDDELGGFGDEADIR